MQDLPLYLKLPHNVHRDTLVQLFLDVLFFLLYQTQQIPEPIQLLKRNDHGMTLKNANHGTTARNRQSTVVAKRISSFLQQAEHFERSLSDIFSMNYVREVNVVVGGTPFSPKEVFSVDFSDFKLSYSSVVVSQRTSMTCSRDLCVSLMRIDELYHRTLTPTNTYVLVRAKKSNQNKEWKPWLNYKVSNQKLRLKINLHPDAEEKKAGAENDQKMDPAVDFVVRQNTGRKSQWIQGNLHNKENLRTPREDPIQRKDARKELSQAANATRSSSKRMSRSLSDSKVNQSTEKSFVSKFKGESEGQRENLMKESNPRTCDCDNLANKHIEGASKGISRSRVRRLSAEEALEIILASNNDNCESGDSETSCGKLGDLLPHENRPLTQDTDLIIASKDIHCKCSHEVCNRICVDGRCPSGKDAPASSLEEDEQLIWFMSPVVLKGFKY